MAKKRVKAKVEPIKQVEETSKVRETEPKSTLKIIEKVLTVITPVEKIDNKKLPNDSRFERHKSFGDITKRAEFNERVKQGLLKWVYYALDNDNGYQYYIKIKK